MIEAVIQIADELLKIVPKNQRDVIKTFKRNFLKNEIHTARIISDELVDFYLETYGDGALLEAARELYSRTMEHYEINN